MKCSAVDDLLLEFAEETLDWAVRAEVQEHLDGCAACRERLRDTQELIGDLSEAKSASIATNESSSFGGSGGRPVAVMVWGKGTRLGDFEIVEELGRGGMGTVYRARQVSLNRVVALKVLSAAMAQSQKLVSRFVTEAHAAAKLHHTNIVAVYAQGEHDGHLFYAMELIEGESLDKAIHGRSGEWFAARAHRDYQKMARLISEVADALEHAHSQSVIHRDIKPQNLMLGADGRLHVTDFGLARLFDEPGVTMSGEMLGTPAYMSPEQVGADRRKVDHRTDVFSLGVTFYEMLTGRRPFEGATREQVVARICTTEPTTPRKLAPGVPVDLETICLRAMEKEPGRRYQTAGEMAADLRRYADDVPIRARRAGPIEKAWKWARRNPAKTAVAAAVILLGAGTTAWSIQHGRQQRATADRMVRDAWESLAYVDYRKPEEAARLLDAAEPLGPERGRWLGARGFSRLMTDKRGSMRLLEEAVQLRPNDRELQYLLAWISFRNDEFERCDELIRRADAAGGPPTAAAYFMRGMARVRQAPALALPDFQKAESQRTNYGQAMTQIGRALNQLAYMSRSLEHWDEEQVALSAACRLQSTDAYPRYYASLAYRLAAEIQGEDFRDKNPNLNHMKALSYALDAQKVEARNPRGYVAEAEYWEQARDYQKARVARGRGKPYLSDNDRSEHYEYNWRLQFWTGDLDGALDDLRTLASIPAGNSPRRTWFMSLFPALITAEKGDLPGAVAMTERQAAAEPTNPISVASAACMLHVLGRGDKAEALLTHGAGQMRYSGLAVPGLPPESVREAFEYATGRLSRDQMTILISKQLDPKWLKAIAAFVDGCRELGRKHRAAALERFREADQCYDDEGFCYLSRVFVRKMESNPDWPRWLSAE